MSTQSIELTGIKARGFHGVFDFEKREGQDFIVDVNVLTAHLDVAAVNDDLNHTVDYALIAKAVTDRITGEPFDLIEALAWTIAGDIYDLCVQKLPQQAGDGVQVMVTVHKPHAPIDAEFSDVSVTVHRQPAFQAPPAHTPSLYGRGFGGWGVVSVGANVGDARAAVAGALDALDGHPSITVEKRSSLYVSAPVGGIEQDDFINATAVVSTKLSAQELLAVCQGIELAYGRTRDVRWGPRTLDMDLIRFVPSAPETPWAADDARCELQQEDPLLTLPHPEAHNRAFVLVPWAEISPNATVHVDGQVVSINDRIRQLGPQGVERV